jgi:hypothetical protein
MIRIQWEKHAKFIHASIGGKFSIGHIPPMKEKPENSCVDLEIENILKSPENTNISKDFIEPLLQITVVNEFKRMASLNQRNSIINKVKFINLFKRKNDHKIGEPECLDSDHLSRYA